MAVALVLLFSSTAAGVVWLARDVDRAISNRGAAQSVAFQAARAGAQRVDVARLRLDGVLVLDEATARSAGAETAHRLLSAYGLDGVVTTLEVEGDRMTVAIEVFDSGRTVSGVGVARASDGNGEPEGRWRTNS
jgi:hypothetical protein